LKASSNNGPPRHGRPGEDGAAADATAQAAHPAWVQRAGDVSGAFADLGTFLPLVLGAFAVRALDPSGVLAGFGIFALAVALVYRRPMPVQPMKIVAALVIAGGLGAAELAATGLLLGLALVLLGITGAVSRLSRLVPGTVLAGIQLGVGLYLAWAGVQLAGEAPIVAGVALAVLVLLHFTPLRPFGALIVVAGAAAWGLTRPGAWPVDVEIGLWLPGLQLPGWSSFRVAGEAVFLPQLALTVTNAVLVTAVIAAEYFPGDRERITPERLALTSGGLNLLLAPFGAFPMCHGAGGLVVQHRFGARTGLAPAIFGAACLGLGLLLGPGALELMSVLPLAAVGSLLMLAGAELGLTRRMRCARPDGFAVILVTGLACVVFNVAVGLLVGLGSELVRAWVRRWRTAD